MSEQPQSTGSAHIVVGVDGSEPSREALRWAAHYAQTIGASIDAVISWHYPSTYGLGGVLIDWDPESEARKVLADTVTAVLGSHLPPTLTQVVREGNPAQVLLDETKDARMLVVGSRGHGGFAGLLLGSVSANCAEHAQCPVLVIHGKAQS
ncbi:MAG: universal stress protein UspA [Frankiales bacterium]|nr:universal stress protein UspA [Frankiales bacterium]